MAIAAALAMLGACSANNGVGSGRDGSGQVPLSGGVPPTGQATGGQGAAGIQQAPVPSLSAQFRDAAGGIDRVFFGFDQHRLDADSVITAQRMAAWLLASPGIAVIVEGHADERGTREYNLALGERRAQALKDALVAGGVGPSRILTISYGKERPIAAGSTEDSWAQNRRAVVVLQAAPAS